MDVSDIYNIARYRLLNGLFNWTTANLVVTAWSGALEFHPEDERIEDLIARGPVPRGSSMSILSQTVTLDGTAQTSGVIIPAVPVGASISFLTVGEQNTPIETSELILFIDDAVYLPFVPNGLDMVIQPDWLSQRGWWRP